MSIKYSVEYQYMAKGDARPSDDGEVVGIQATDENGLVLLPNVGDYVQVDNRGDGGERASFNGKVRTRLFRYLRSTDNDIFCHVNIVVEETDDNWGRLIKE